MTFDNNRPSAGIAGSPRGVVLLSWLRRWGITALGVLLAAFLSGGRIGFTSIGSLLAAAAIISLLNVFLRPLLVLFTLPFVLLTMGFGILLINALLFKLTAVIVTGFVVTSWWAAIWGALVVSIVSIFVNGVLFGPSIQVRTASYGPAGRGVPPTGQPGQSDRRGERIRNKDDDDVIDV